MHPVWFVIILSLGHLWSGEVVGQEGLPEINQTITELVANNHVEASRQTKDLLSMVASMDSQSRASHSIRMDHDNSGVRGRMRFDWDISLDKVGAYRLDWRLNYASNRVTFALELAAGATNDSSAFQFHQGRDIFAFGFSDYGELKSSDYCIIWFDLSHQIHLQDASTDHNNRLELIDSTESVCKLVRFSPPAVQVVEDAERRAEDYEEDGDETRNEPRRGKNKTEIVFSRPLDVCEPPRGRKYYTIDNGTTHLVWFTLRGPVLSIDGLNLTSLMVGSSATKDHQKEFDFGMTRVQIITEKHHQRREEKSNKSVNGRQVGKVHDVRMDRYSIPGRETTYWCKLFKLPAKFESRKYHITSYEAVIEGASEGLDKVVHHMELFNCANLSPSQWSDLSDLYERQGGWQGECSSLDRPKATEPCRRVILAWAMGARPLVYPEQVGQPIGGPNYSPFVVLEVHYNNIDSRADLVDSSGLRFHYTSRLRPFGAGVLEVGLEYTDKNSVPPGLVAPLAGHCVSECTRAALSGSTGSGSGSGGGGGGGGGANDDATKSIQDKQEGIYIFAAQLHTHLAGVASWTEHVREGRLLRELQRDDHYSPHFQEIRLLPRPVHVRPGDALVHYCLYDTRRRPNITLGGYATSDEMCVTYLHYYPKIDLEVCKSSVETRALERYFDHLAREESQNTSSRLRETIGEATASEPNGGWPPVKAKSVAENYRSIEWSPRRSHQLLEFYASAPLSVQCNRSNGERWPGGWNGVTPTRLWNDDHDKDDLRPEDERRGQLMNDHEDQLAGPEDEPPQGRPEEPWGRMQLPYEWRPLCGHQLADYRGVGYRRRHAQCRRGQRGARRPTAG